MPARPTTSSPTRKRPRAGNCCSTATTLSGWKNNNDKPVKAKIEDGAINPHGSGGYLLVYDKPFGDFIFKCDVRWRSRIATRASSCARAISSDPVHSGIEAQIVSDTKPGLHGFASIYDLVAPSKDATNGPGKWDTVEIRCEGPNHHSDGQRRESDDNQLRRVGRAGKRPDGSQHKFGKAIKDFPRKGYIGLQDHGYDAWYKNIKLKEL